MPVWPRAIAVKTRYQSVHGVTRSSSRPMRRSGSPPSAQARAGVNTKFSTRLAATRVLARRTSPTWAASICTNTAVSIISRAGSTTCSAAAPMGSSRPAARPARAARATNRLWKRSASDIGSVLLDGVRAQGAEQAGGLPGRGVGVGAVVGMDTRVQMHPLGVKSMRRSKKAQHCCSAAASSATCPALSRGRLQELPWVRGVRAALSSSARQAARRRSCSPASSRQVAPPFSAMGRARGCPAWAGGARSARNAHPRSQGASWLGS